MANLIVRQSSWARIMEWMLCDGEEHLAFVLARFEIVGRNIILREQDLVIIEDYELEAKGRLGLELKLPTLIKMMNLTTRSNTILIEIHSHPFSFNGVDFSSIDTDGQEAMMSYMADAVSAKAYGALVIGAGSVKGRLLFPNSKPQMIHQIKLVGTNVTNLSADGRQRNTVEENLDRDKYHRQALALGVEGNKAIQNVRAAIVGLGGIGSLVNQQLAHLGLSQITYIDDDFLEKSNLNRVIGTTRADIGKAKVELASRYARKINPDLKTKIIQKNIKAEESIAALKNCDVIFGCMDTDSGRLILSELASAYLIPYIDAAVGITVEKGKITESGGRVLVWSPDHPCLNCANEIDMRVAAEELESKQEREFRKRHGYVTGVNVPEPAVISLNGTIASMAVTEYLVMFSGIRPFHHYICYDFMAQKTVQRIINRKENCVICGLQGRGIEANLERYIRHGLPKDIPKVSSIT